MHNRLSSLTLATLVACTANAIEFDGINLNGNAVEITRQFSDKGYAYSFDYDCLKGNYKGSEIFVTLDKDNVRQINRLGQLIVEIPESETVTLESVEKEYEALASCPDGTKVTVSKGDIGIKVVFTTPYYKE